MSTVTELWEPPLQVSRDVTFPSMKAEVISKGSTSREEHPVLWFRKQSSSISLRLLAQAGSLTLVSSLPLILGRCRWPTSAIGLAFLPAFLRALSLCYVHFPSIRCPFNELFSELGPWDIEENKIERPCPHRAYILAVSGTQTMKK